MGDARIASYLSGKIRELTSDLFEEQRRQAARDIHYRAVIKSLMELEKYYSYSSLSHETADKAKVEIQKYYGKINPKMFDDLKLHSMIKGFSPLPTQTSRKT